MRSILTDIAFGFCMFVIGIATAVIPDDPVLGGSVLSFYDAKDECENSGDECVMVFDFVPVKKEKSE